jgi:hypothetical protein
MVWVSKTLTTGESGPENAPDHVVGLRIARCFAAAPPLGNRIKHIICNGFSCGKQEVEETIVPAIFNICSGAKITIGQKATLWRPKKTIREFLGTSPTR